MTKSTRANESSSSEVRELREGMQKMLLEVGTLAKEVSNLKKLDLDDARAEGTNDKQYNES